MQIHFQNLFTKINLQTKLLGAFLTLGSLAFAVALVGWNSNSRLSDRIDALSQDSLPSLSSLWKIQEGQTQIIALEQGLSNIEHRSIKSGSGFEQQSRLNTMNEAWQQIEAGFQQYEATLLINNSSEAIVYTQFKQNWQAWKLAHQEAINDYQEFVSLNISLPYRKAVELTQQGKQTSVEMAKVKRALDLLERFEQQIEDNEPVARKARTSLQQLIELNTATATRTQNQAISDASITRLFMLMSMVIGSITAIGLGLILSRMIARPIDQRIQTMLADLEFARDTLEERVEERTQELKEALQHLTETQSQLIHSEKMSSLGQMVAGVAHEINNPVNFIYGNISHADEYVRELVDLLRLYQKHYPQPVAEIQARSEDAEIDFLAEDLPKILSSMKLGSDRIRQIVLSLRNFSRLDEAEKKAADIHEGIDSTLLILSHRLKKGIDVIKHYGDLPLVECYPAQLNQVFMNILNNSVDALMSQPENSDKKITIETFRLGNSAVQIRLQDNGQGIPAAVQSKIFDPFFTTKPIGQGTGLGLSICYQIMEKHQGKISVNSEAGAGTEFVLTLPIKS